MARWSALAMDERLARGIDILRLLYRADAADNCDCEVIKTPRAMIALNATTRAACNYSLLQLPLAHDMKSCTSRVLTLGKLNSLLRM